MVKSQLAERKGLNVSLFERLCKKYPQNVTILKKQYRMNKDIMEVSNSIIYNGVMTHGDPFVANQAVDYTQNVK